MFVIARRVELLIIMELTQKHCGSIHFKTKKPKSFIFGMLMGNSETVGAVAIRMANNVWFNYKFDLIEELIKNKRENKNHVSKRSTSFLAGYRHLLIIKRQKIIKMPSLSLASLLFNKFASKIF